MSFAPFDQARLKLSRAAFHIGLLRSELGSYLAKGPVKFNAWPSSDPNLHHFCITVTEPIPADVAAIIGDIVHNLRTTLDLTACELVRQNGGDPKNVHFPFCRDEQSLGCMIAKRNFDQASQEAINLLRFLAPYQDGNPHLRGIHDLDIIDKHRAILPVGANIRAGGATSASQALLERGHVIARGKFSSWAAGTHSPDEDVPASLSLVFPDGLPYAGLDVLQTLSRLLEYFERIVDAFEAPTLGKKPDIDSLKITL